MKLWSFSRRRRSTSSLLLLLWLLLRKRFDGCYGRGRFSLQKVCRELSALVGCRHPSRRWSSQSQSIAECCAGEHSRGYR
uniref:Putative secreted protein n=1 Tax=Anopheles darlingi TaxID=43151 RepID=A0A2M4DPS7_ANODA